MLLNDIWIPLTVSTFLSVHGYSSTSLSMSGAMAAFIVGFLTLYSDVYSLESGWILSMVLIGFYLLGSRVSKIGHAYKATVDGQVQNNTKESTKKRVGAQRSAAQVFGTALLGTFLACYYAYLNRHFSSSLQSVEVGKRLLRSYVALYACNLGDTFASELGILSKSDPVLITTFRRVPRGTNGAISLLGCFASVLGAVLLWVWTIFWIWLLGQTSGDVSHSLVWSELVNWEWFCVFLLGSVLGMFLDSIIGALFQVSYFYQGRIYNTYPTINKKTDSQESVQWISGWNVLSNEQVNFVSSSITAMAFYKWY